MEAPQRTAFISASKGGELWRPGEWKKIVNGVSRKGTLLKIFDSSVPTGIKADTAVHGALSARAIAFSCVAFGPEMPAYSLPDASKVLLTGGGGSKKKTKYSYAYPMAAGDQRGHLFAFDFIRNRFWLVARTGVASTSIAFSKLRKREIIVGLSDCSLHSYNIDSCQLVAKLPAFHHTPPHYLSIHPVKSLAISTSATEALLWDTENWTRKRLLTGNECGVQQSSFSPDGISIITAFEDGSIFVWFMDTFTLQWKLSLEQITGTPFAELDAEMLAVVRDSYFASSIDGEILAYSGLSSTLYVWNTVEKRLIHEILIPGFQDLYIKKIDFVGNSKIVSLLSNKGHMIFVDVIDAKFIGQLQGKHTFHTFALSGDGYTLITILRSSKHVINMLALDAVLGLQSNDSEQEQAQDTMDSVDDLDALLQLNNPKKVSITVDQPKTFFELVESKKDSKVLSRHKLRGFLNHYGVFPEKHRILIWRYLLKLPENREQYEALLQLGSHPQMLDFRKKFPLKSEKLSKTMEKIMSALAHWSPLFESLDYLPALVFPFARLFSSDLFSGLEVVMTVLLNWCQKWWDYYPNPPVECLDIMEELLGFHDPELIGHFTEHKITSQIFGWLPMHTLFSELFLLDDWLRVWDHLVSNPPSFMYFIIVAYSKYFRTALLKTDKHGDFRFFFQRKNPVNTSKLLLLAYELQGNTPMTVSPASFLQPFEPLLRGQYPVFNRYPEFIINYQTKMKDRIRQDEEEYLRQRKSDDDAKRLNRPRQKPLSGSPEPKPRDQDNAPWKVNDTMDAWWDKMTGEDKYTQDRRARLEELENDPRAQTIHVSPTQAAAAAQKASFSTIPLEKVDEYRKFEEDWKKRKDDMIQSRERMSTLYQNRERAARHSTDEGSEGNQMSIGRSASLSPTKSQDDKSKSPQKVSFAAGRGPSG